MDQLLSPENIWRLSLFLVAATGLSYALNRSFGKALLSRVTLRGRRDSTAKTPPRSFSPDKPQPSSPISYNSALPPQRRAALADVKSDVVPWQEVSEEEVSRQVLPMKADYRTSPGNLYTPTGFSIQEVKALGDFPDYATLSGVPLPSPYPQFDINKAISRPYRPFRWAYHQTMCMSSSSLN